MNRLINKNKLKWVCHHLHIDKSYTLQTNQIGKSEVHMKDKWHLMRDIKKNIIRKT